MLHDVSRMRQEKYKIVFRSKYVYPIYCYTPEL